MTRRKPPEGNPISGHSVELRSISPRSAFVGRMDTAHWTNAPGPGQELVRLNTGKLGGLGVRGKRISGRDLVAMGHMKCGQPPDVRDCRPDDVAARLHTECAGWNEKATRQRRLI